jgi:DNA-binding HxlR family transcriptional regulator
MLMPTPDEITPDETTSEEIWNEVYALIPKMREAVRNGLKRDQEKYLHDVKRIQLEREGLNITLQFLRKKWVIDIIYILSILKRPYFNQIRKSVPEINSRTLTVRLKEFEKQGILTRTVENSQPLRVYYELTELGQGIYELILPLLLFHANAINRRTTKTNTEGNEE